LAGEEDFSHVEVVWLASPFPLRWRGFGGKFLLSELIGSKIKIVLRFFISGIKKIARKLRDETSPDFW